MKPPEDYSPKPAAISKEEINETVKKLADDSWFTAVVHPGLSDANEAKTTIKGFSGFYVIDFPSPNHLAVYKANPSEYVMAQHDRADWMMLWHAANGHLDEFMKLFPQTKIS